MTSPQFEFLEWDTQFFGFRIARITADILSTEELSSVLHWCRAERIRCLYWLVAIGERSAIQMAEEHRFALVDIRVTLEMKPKPTQRRSTRVRLAREDDLPTLLRIAGSAHTDSRFYSDPNFPRERCDELYRVWVEKSVKGYAERVLVAEEENGPAGYITCHRNDYNGSIGLMAVADWARGRGLGDELVASSVDFFAASGASFVSVVTQARNISAQRLYQRSGFLTRSVQLWYHRWFSQP